MESRKNVTLSFSDEGCSAKVDDDYFQLGEFFAADLNGYEDWIQDTLLKCDEILAGTTPYWSRNGNTCFLEIDQSITNITDGLFDGSVVSLPTEQFRRLVECWLRIMRNQDGKQYRFSVNLRRYEPKQ